LREKNLIVLIEDETKLLKEILPIKVNI